MVDTIVAREMQNIKGESCAPVASDLTFDYACVPERYHASTSPDDLLVLYKGAVRLVQPFFRSLALEEGLSDVVLTAKRVLESDTDEERYRLIDDHTSYKWQTPFLSATENPEWAQVFASTNPMRRLEKTIYRLRIRAARCIVDCFDTGHCGISKEVLILGAIYPEEITAVKIINNDAHSELLDARTRVISMFPDRKRRNTDVKDIANWTVHPGR